VIATVLDSMDGRGVSTGQRPFEPARGGKSQFDDLEIARAGGLPDQRLQAANFEEPARGCSLEIEPAPKVAMGPSQAPKPTGHGKVDTSSTRAQQSSFPLSPWLTVNFERSSHLG